VPRCALREGGRASYRCEGEQPSVNAPTLQAQELGEPSVVGSGPGGVRSDRALPVAAPGRWVAHEQEDVGRDRGRYHGAPGGENQRRPDARDRA
jgi:hypothetical protein